MTLAIKSLSLFELICDYPYLLTTGLATTEINIVRSKLLVPTMYTD